MLSPLAGVVLEMVLAWRYGGSGTVDAYRTAYLLIGFGNQLFIAYLLPHIVVPMITDFRSRGEEEQGWRVAITTGHLLGGIGIFFALGICIYPTPVAEFLAPGLTGGALSEAITLLRFFSVALVLALWSGVITGILYVHRVFALSPLSQMLTNILVIAAVLASAKNRGSLALGIGVVFGFGAMFALHVFYLYRVAAKAGIRMSLALRPGRWRDIGKLLLTGVPLLVMLAATQFGTIIANRELSRLSIGTLARFGFAWKLMALVNFAPASLATVIFPAFSEAQAHERSAEFSRLIDKAVRMTLLLTVPISMVLYLLRGPLVRLLFGRGAMDEMGLQETMFLFGLALLQGPVANLTLLFQKVFFSLGNTRAPAIVSVLIALGLFALMPWAATIYGAGGVALTYAVVYWVSIAGLIGALYLAGVKLRNAELAGYSLAVLALSAGVLAPVWLIHQGFSAWGNPAPPKEILELTVCAILAGGVIKILAPLFRISEAEDLFEYMRWQLSRGARQLKGVQVRT